MNFTWQSLMSSACVRDILSMTAETQATLPTRTVDEAMTLALLAMTSKLLRIYAFNAFVTGREPTMNQVKPYLAGSGSTPPLDWHNFPQLFGDLSAIKKEVIGNPMYDPSGMQVALVTLGAAPEQL